MVEVTESREEDVLVVKVDGKIDAASSPLLERKINGFLDAGARKLVVNFENVDYLSSAGLRLLLNISKKLAGLGGRMVLAAPQETVMEVVRMAGFDRVLDISTSELEAVKVLSR